MTLTSDWSYRDSDLTHPHHQPISKNQGESHAVASQLAIAPCKQKTEWRSCSSINSNDRKN